MKSESLIHPHDGDASQHPPKTLKDKVEINIPVSSIKPGLLFSELETSATADFYSKTEHDRQIEATKKGIARQLPHEVAIAKVVVEKFEPQYPLYSAIVEANLGPDLKIRDIKGIDKLSFRIDTRDQAGAQETELQKAEKVISKLCKDIDDILKDPFRVSHYLQDLDNKIGKIVEEQGLSYQKSDLPQYIIEGRFSFVPGPPPENYRPRKHSRALNQELLNREQEAGINERGVAKFVGIIPGAEAEKFIKKGNVFSEEAQVIDILEHSKYSHRLQFEVIRKAVSSGDLIMPRVIDARGDESEMNQKQLLELLITCKSRDAFTPRENKALWRYLLDDIRSALYPTHKEASDKKNFNSDKYIFSCNNPTILNSLILSFGEDLGLPNLQHYLLNSHWKESARMVDKMRRSDVGQAFTGDNFSSDYSSCIKYREMQGLYFASQRVEKAAASAKYENFGRDDSSAIKRKITSPQPVGYYESMEDYIKEKQPRSVFRIMSDKFSSLLTASKNPNAPSK